MSDLSFRCFLPTLDTNTVAIDYEAALSDFVWVQDTVELPPAIRHRAPYRARFQDGAPIVWIQNSITGFLTPFWVPATFASHISGIVQGALASSLDPALSRALAWAGGIVAPDVDIASSNELLAKLNLAARNFSEHGYVSINGVLHSAFVHRMREYYRELTLIAFDQLDSLGEHEYGLHSESMARFVQFQLAPLVSMIAGRPLLPSYSFFRSYHGGAALAPHTDRDQCEVTISLLVDFDSPTDQAYSWPIYVGPESGAVELHQQIGDMLILRGRRLRHWRSPLAPLCRSSSLLLHYVDETFCRSLR